MSIIESVCCNGGKIIETTVGAAWNSFFHAAVGGLALAPIGAAIKGLPIPPMIGMGASGAAIVGAMTGLVRSGAGFHFKPHQIESEIHFVGEMGLSLFTTFIGGPAGNWALGLNLPSADFLATTGYPAAIMVGLTVVGFAAKKSHEYGCFSACPSLPKLPSWCPSLSKFSLFGGSSSSKSNGSKEINVSARLEQMDLERRLGV